jgi:hypothetical protein
MNAVSKHLSLRLSPSTQQCIGIKIPKINREASAYL